MKNTLSPSMIVICLLFIVLQLSGCATSDKYSDIPVTTESTVVMYPPKFEEAGAANYASQFALMALFAKAAYREDILDKKDRRYKACEYLTHPEHRDVLLDMPRDVDGGGWARWTEMGSCYSENGLYFETYVHSNSKGNIDQAVIGIRGTENNSRFEMLNDWEANASGMTYLGKTEYDQAKGYITPVIDKLALIQDSNGKPIEIYLTGHSLEASPSTWPTSRPRLR